MACNKKIPCNKDKKAVLGFFGAGKKVCKKSCKKVCDKNKSIQNI